MKILLVMVIGHLNIRTFGVLQKVNSPNGRADSEFEKLKKPVFINKASVTKTSPEPKAEPSLLSETA